MEELGAKAGVGRGRLLRVDQDGLPHFVFSRTKVEE